MSAQGGILERRAPVHVPILPVVALLGLAVALAIVISILSGTEGQVAGTAFVGRPLVNSTTTFREQGATLPFEMADNPGTWSLSEAQGQLARIAAIQKAMENSTAAVREQGAGVPTETDARPAGPAPVPYYRGCDRCHQRI